MKKFLAAFVCGAFLLSSITSIQADPLLFDTNPPVIQQQEIQKGVQPNVNYPTVMIGQFMSFCINMIMMKLSSEGVPRNIAAENAGYVCSCIMDSYREENQQAEFQFELTRKNEGDVPLFKKHYTNCSLLNAERTGNMNINPRKSIWVNQLNKPENILINFKEKK
jgi:hypothetical protein